MTIDMKRMLHGLSNEEVKRSYCNSVDTIHTSAKPVLNIAVQHGGIAHSMVLLLL